MQKLEHAGVVSYEDFFLDEKAEDGIRKLVVCIVMELCERGDLAVALQEQRRKKVFLSESSVVMPWSEQLCSALAYMHENKTLHRDLKPLNIFITGSNQASLLSPCLPCAARQWFLTASRGTVEDRRLWPGPPGCGGPHVARGHAVLPRARGPQLRKLWRSCGCVGSWMHPARSALAQFSVGGKRPPRNQGHADAVDCPTDERQVL
jgi:serine/threonine protein kinase